MTDIQANQNAALFSWTPQFWDAYTFGNRFQVTTAGYALRIGWYRGGTGGFGYSRIGMFNPSGGTVIDVTTPADNGAVGWQWTTLATPVPLATGTTYTIAGLVSGSNKSTGAVARSSAPGAPSPFIWDDAANYYNGGGWGYPNSGPQTNMMNLNLTWSEFAAGEPGPGEGDPSLTGDLAGWLSNTPAVQAHETDGLPWLTKAAVDSSRGVLDALSTVVTNISNAIGHVTDTASTTGSVLARVAQLLLDTAAILARIPADILTSISELMGWVSSWFGDAPRPEGTPTLPATLNDIWLRTLALWHRTETSNWLEPLPGTDWVLQDTLDWDGAVAWSQPADVYVLHITTVPDYFSEIDAAGIRHFPRAAWWSPLTGTFPHERRYAEFEFQVLHNLPLRSQGILLRPKSGFAGTLEAWLRPDPPPP